MRSKKLPPHYLGTAVVYHQSHFMSSQLTLMRPRIYVKVKRIQSAINRWVQRLGLGLVLQFSEHFSLPNRSLINYVSRLVEQGLSHSDSRLLEIDFMVTS